MTLYSKTNRLKAMLWGVVFIVIGLVLCVGMVILWLTQAFSVLYVVFIISSILPIWAGIATINSGKYPIVLLVDNVGVHYFVDIGIWGGKKQITLLWSEIDKVTYVDDDFEAPTALHIVLKGENPEPIIIHDAIIDNPKELMSEIGRLSGNMY